MFATQGNALYDAHLNILGQLEQKHIWFKMINLKKLSAWAEALHHEIKVAQEAPRELRGIMLSHVHNKRRILVEKADQRLGYKKVFDEFVHMVEIAFPGNAMVKRKLRDVIKMHGIFLEDAVKAKRIVRSV